MHIVLRGPKTRNCWLRRLIFGLRFDKIDGMERSQSFKYEVDFRCTGFPPLDS